MKQLKIDFVADGNRLPLNYNSLMLSVLKGVVQKSDAGLFDEWFNKNRNSSELGKSYTFSCYFPQPVFSKEGVLYKGDYFSFFLSTYNLLDLMNLYNAFVGAFQRHDVFPKEGGGTLRIQGMNALEIPDVRSNVILVKFESPLLVRRHSHETNRDTFLTCSDPGFADALRDSTEKALKSAKLDISVEDFNVVPVRPRRTVVHYFNNLSVVANLGDFELQGSPELLTFLHCAGLGAATSSGHGKFRILNR